MDTLASWTANSLWQTDRPGFIGRITTFSIARFANDAANNIVINKNVTYKEDNNNDFHTINTAKIKSSNF